MARLVAKGYSQKHKIEYDEVFTLVTRLEIIRLIIVIAAQHRCQISFCKLLSSRRGLH